MITDILTILRSDKWEGVSEHVDQAKGAHEYPKTIRQSWQQFKRAFQWLKK